MPADLHKEDYYHGLLPRLDAEDLLLSTGDCVVRASHEPPSASSTTPSERDYILSVCIEPGSATERWRRPGFEPLPKIVKHVLIYRTTSGRYCIAKDYFGCIPSLIAHYAQAAPIINKNIHTNPLFLTPIGRARWELEPEEVAVGRMMRSGKTREIHFGTLHAGRGRGELDAIKSAEMRKESVKEMMHEVRCLLACRSSPFVMRLHGALLLAEPCLMVLEQASEFLSSYLERNVGIGEPAKLELCYQSALAISYVHSLDFVVRNIAARNFFCCNGKVKFGDFSLARRLAPLDSGTVADAVGGTPPPPGRKKPSVPRRSPSSSSDASSMTSPSKSEATMTVSRSRSVTACSTSESAASRRSKPSFRDTSSLALPIRWRAPECLQYASYSQKSDVWAFGVLCWEIYHAGRMPLPGMNSGEVQHFILTGQHPAFEACTPRVKEYIGEKIFAELPDDRWVMEESAKMFDFFLNDGKKSSQEKTDSKEKVGGSRGNSKEEDKKKEKG